MARAARVGDGASRESVVINIVASPALRSAVDGYARRLSRERGITVKRSAAARELLLAALRAKAIEKHRAA